MNCFPVLTFNYSLERCCINRFEYLVDWVQVTLPLLLSEYSEHDQVLVFCVNSILDFIALV